MKIKFLGTAAFEGVPSLFCNCRVCRESKKAGGRNIRSRSQALLDDAILLDFNADTVCHYQKYGFDWDKIEGCLITHSHSDHLYPKDMVINGPGYADCHMVMRFWAPESGYEAILPVTRASSAVEVHKAEPGKASAVGKYTVMPLWANHDPSATPVIYAIEADGKRILYAHDTGLFPKQTWDILETMGRFDLVSLDCTGCDREDGWLDNHLSLRGDRMVVQEMREKKLADENTRVVLNHFSHNGGRTYDEMVRLAEPLGMIVSYDGMELTF